MPTAAVISLEDHRLSRRRGVPAGAESSPDARRASPARRRGAVIVRWDRRLGRVVDLRILGGRVAVLGLRLAQIAGWAFVGGLTAFVFCVGLADMIWPGMGGPF